MSTTRSVLGIVILAFLAATIGGCVYVSPRAAKPLSQEPLLLDEAMGLRDWERSTAWYQNGRVVAGTVPVPLRPRVGQVYHGVRFEPTHTAQPPLEQVR